MSQVQKSSQLIDSTLSLPNTEKVTSRFNIDEFMNCHLPKYSGESGAAALLQWFEGVEYVFTATKCPAHLHVKYAVGAFTKYARTWWKHEELTQGVDLVYAITWNDLKTSMLVEFVSRNEIRTLEKDFRELKQIGGDNAEYTSRFHKLSVLFPQMVTPLSVAVERYLGGLPSIVRDNVLGVKPASLGEASRIAALVTDKLVENGELGNKAKGKKKIVEDESSECKEPFSKKRKAETSSKHVINSSPNSTTPQQLLLPSNQNKKYLGDHPKCPRCDFHHNVNYKCRRCSICDQFGHWTSTCRKKAHSIPASIMRVIHNQCFICGSYNHQSKKCPKHISSAQP